MMASIDHNNNNNNNDINNNITMVDDTIAALPLQ